MKILVISPTPTHPPNAGNRVRIFALSSALREMGHEVHFSFIPTESADTVEMARWWDGGYHSLPYTRKTQTYTVFERMTKWLSERVQPDLKYTYRIDDWFDDSVLELLRSLDSKFNFDAVLVEYVFISKAFEAFGERVIKILDTHDVFTDRHKLYLSNNRPPQWFSTTRRQEAIALSRADAVIAIQEKERAFFSTLTQAQVITVGHLVRVEPLWQENAGRRTLLFVGSGNPINVECVQSFMATTFPLIEAALPGTRLLVAGTVCDRLGEFHGMSKLGALPDIATAYREADVVVNPVGYGTGLNVKTVEALGFGMPVVSTPVGAKGLDADPVPLLVADGAQAFASAAVRVLTEPQLASDLAGRAITFARSWNARNSRILETLLNGKMAANQPSDPAEAP